jgi:signal transduction histidine kinase
MKKNTTILCDEDFVILEVLQDDYNLITQDLVTLTFLKIVDKSCLNSAFKFQQEVSRNNIAFNWELNLIFPDQTGKSYLAGIKEDKKIFLIITRQLQDISQFIAGVQSLFSRQPIVASQSGKHKLLRKTTDKDENIYEEFTRINNNLVNLHRELSKKNVILEKQQKYLELINRILRHDLANHFTVIKSAVNLFNKSKNMDILEEITNHVNKGIMLIRNMKQLEAVFSAEPDLKPRNLLSTIKLVISNYQNIDFEIELQEIRILADEGLEIIIDNLIRNAVRHGKTEKIRISSEETDSTVIIKIADFGKGILDEIKDKIFTESFKAGASGNTGLGLFIVDRMMQNYGGSVQVADNQPQGAVFLLEFNKA